MQNINVSSHNLTGSFFISTHKVLCKISDYYVNTLSRIIFYLDVLIKQYCLMKLASVGAQMCDNVLIISPWMKADHQHEIPPLEQTKKEKDSDK